MYTEFGFVSGAFERERFVMLGVRGREEISRLSWFEIRVQHDGPLSQQDVERLFAAPCAIALGPDGAAEIVRGVVTRVRSLPRPFQRAAPDPSHDYHDYAISIAPSVQLLTLSASDRVFQNLTIEGLTTALLAPHNLASEEAFRRAFTDGPPLEYAVQYDETDWDFLQRRLEHEGKYYYFEHAGPRDRLVVGDANSGATRIGKLALLPSPPPESRAEIVEWTFDETRVTARVAVLDYDPMTPDRRIAAKAAVGDPRTRSISTFGTVVRFGEQLVDHDAASRIAGLRAQRTACEAKVYAGRTTSRRLRAGVVFELAGHREDDGEYLATEIEHRGGVLPDSADDVDEEYRGSFRAIPIDRQFRPELRTRWPRIHGFTIGHIATDGAGATAMLDEHGRYKVKLVFDVATTRGAASSMWIRMAQPYAGASEGSHHPLRKGTEVLIAHLDGDPDRPVIVGAVPNPFTVSPTTAQNPTQSVVQTASGIRIEIEDHQETR